MSAEPVGLKRRAAVVAAVLTACFGSTVALGDDHATMGTPGAPGCAGQTEAFFAQLGQAVDNNTGNGIGGLARSADISPRDLHAAAVANCSVTP
jgi:hypothetical protein